MPYFPKDNKFDTFGLHRETRGEEYFTQSSCKYINEDKGVSFSRRQKGLLGTWDLRRSIGN